MKPPDHFEFEWPGRAKVSATGWPAMLLAVGLVVVVSGVLLTMGIIRLP